jgi:hypothetical protein
MRATVGRCCTRTTSPRWFFPRVVALQRRLLQQPQLPRRPASLPDLCGRARSVAGAAATARVEGEAGTQRGLKCLPSALVSTARDSKVEPGIDHRGTAARARMRPRRQRALLERRPARKTHEVRFVGGRVSAHADRVERVPGRDHRFRSSIRGRSGCCRRLVRQPDRVAGVRLRPASLMSAVDVRSLLIRSSSQFGQRRSFRSFRGL